jgi:circadian clock protein KaiB
MQSKPLPAEQTDCPDDSKRLLRLYVAGQTPQSLRAVANVHKLCTEQLGNAWTLEVVDLYQQPALAQDQQLIALPALVKPVPLPARMIVGDMSDTGQVMLALDLHPFPERLTDG